jgi:DNA-binding response OmpR family regulator
MASTRHLLVIDDEPHIWHLLALEFTRLGYTVHVAASLRAARTQLGSGVPFAAILLDLNLPDGSGLDVLREWGGRPPAPVLVVTGEDEDQMLDEVRRLGAAVLTKPFSPSKLAARVASLAGAARETP